MNWLKENLKFNTILSWVVWFILGVILAIKGISYGFLVYASIMLIGRGIICLRNRYRNGSK
jgi:hypothetical protein